jgi:hypothetical protein
MTRRIVLCEGPDDLTALREIALFIFHGRIEKHVMVSGAGEARKIDLRAGTVAVEIISSNGKRKLPGLAATTLMTLPAQMGPPDDAKVKRIALVFDPDESLVSAFHNDIVQAIVRQATAWTLTSVAPGAWIARRSPGERVQLLAIGWKAPGGVVDGLADHQNLDRLLCAMAAKAYPVEAQIVERWLNEVNGARQPENRAKWKAALHLYCALVEEKASELSAPARFLHQNAMCKPHVRMILEQGGLLKALRPLLAAP